MRTWARRRWCLLKTIIDVSVDGAVAKWCNSGAQETVEFQEFYDPPPGRVTQLTRRATLDLVEVVRRNPLRQVGKQELASGKQHRPKYVWELASQTTVEEEQHFVARSALLLWHHKHMGRLHHTSRRSQSRTKRCVRRQHQHRTTSQRADYGIEVLIDSLADNESTSLVVISRRSVRDPCTLVSVLTVRANMAANMAQRAQSSAASCSKMDDGHVPTGQQNL